MPGTGGSSWPVGGGGGSRPASLTWLGKVRYIPTAEGAAVGAGNGAAPLLILLDRPRRRGDLHDYKQQHKDTSEKNVALKV